LPNDWSDRDAEHPRETRRGRLSAAIVAAMVVIGTAQFLIELASRLI
jgi:hypothetical protein